MAHALLSPSSAHRWLNCTPSARLEQGFPDRAGEAAKEGTLAHALCELLLKFKLGHFTKPRFQVLLRKIEKEPLYNADMYNNAEEYALFVMEKFVEAQSVFKHAEIHLEVKLDLTKFVPDGFGTGDCIIMTDGTLEVIDFKYGQGVEVSAENNKQMMLYAIGAVRQFGFLFDVQNVRMTIFQPRINNYSSFEMAIDDLEKWAEEELKPKAEMAHAGQGDFLPGTHCQFCKAKAKCRALADYNLELAKHDFSSPELLSDEDVSDILDRAAAFKNWINSVEEMALEEAINSGKSWAGYKLVEGRSNRKYSDESEISKVLMSNGFNPKDIFQPEKIITITAMEKLLSKETFNEILGNYIIKPQGKPTLVPISDKRPEWNSSEAAAKDFQTH